MQDVLVFLTVAASIAYVYKVMFAPTLFRGSRPDVPVRALVRKRRGEKRRGLPVLGR